MKYRGQVSADGMATGALSSVESVRTFVRLHRARDATGSTAAVQLFDRCLLQMRSRMRVLAMPAEGGTRGTARGIRLSSRARLARLLWLRVTHDYPVVSPRDETPQFRRASISRWANCGAGEQHRYHQYAASRIASPISPRKCRHSSKIASCRLERCERTRARARARITRWCSGLVASAAFTAAAAVCVAMCVCEKRNDNDM